MAALDVTAMLAQRMLPVPLKAPPKMKSPLEIAEEQYKTEPTATKFLGPPSAALWLNGKKTGKRFSTNGVYITSNELEKAELRKMYGVSEVQKVLPIGKVGGA